jgi:DNA-binding NarL/FixJ family response regulator
LIAKTPPRTPEIGVPGRVTGDPLRVLVVSDSPLIAAGLARMVASDPDRAVLVRSGADDRTGVDVVVLGFVGQPGELRELHQAAAVERPMVAVLPPGRPDLHQAATALDLAQVLEYDVPTALLLKTVELAAAGHIRPPAREGADLTERELEILALVGAARSNAEIGRELFLSLNTVKSYIRTAYRKIGVTTRSQAVLWVLDHDLGSPDPSLDAEESE